MAALRTLRDLVWMVVGVLVAALIAEMIIERLGADPPVAHDLKTVTPRAAPRGDTLVLRIDAARRPDACRWRIDRLEIAPGDVDGRRPSSG